MNTPDTALAILKAIDELPVESFTIEREGSNTPIEVEGSCRFVHERDVKTILTLVRSFLNKG